MKVTGYISKSYQGLIVLCCLIIFIGSSVPQSSAISTNIEINSDEEQETQPPQLTISEAVQSTVSLDVSFHSLLLWIIDLPVENIFGVIEPDQLQHNQLKTFRILLSRIISPNAP
jgi:hypothetical protein